MSPWQGHSDGPKLTFEHRPQRESKHSLTVGTEGSRETRKTGQPERSKRPGRDGRGSVPHQTRPVKSIEALVVLGGVEEEEGERDEEL